jgi:cellulose synthase/poly-beta-1,6-N-acetylglucosamine synthase-like glycosyltransferase
MLLYIFIVAIFSLAYAILMLRYSAAWLALPETELNPGFQPKTKISVLIAARNEAEQIESTLASILAQNYSPTLFEIIVIDDHSEDETANLVEAIAAPNLRLLRLAEWIDPKNTGQSYKKMAIEQGIQAAQGELIVCTDADCQVPPDWLRLMAQSYEQGEVQFIAAPVEFSDPKSTFESFQALDFLGMMAITGAGIHGRFMRMCNGANLAYPKAVFEEVGGFEGIDQLASGDDMMLLQKVAKRYPKGIRFLKSPKALVSTAAKSSLKGFVQQRIRWASKSGSYQDWRTQLQLGVVWIFCWSLLISGLLMPLGWPFVACFLAQLLLKALVDYRLLSAATHFFQRPKLLKVFWSALFLHTAYIIGVGSISLFPRKYEWKGRRTR